MISIDENIQSVQAFAPATCANVAVGYDILGFAFDQIGDHVTLTRRQDNKIIIESIQANEELPLDVGKNTASVVIESLVKLLNLDVGFSICIKKGIPLSSGMGGSAASAVAALTAFNAYLSSPLPAHELAHHALLGEEIASGQQHADNVVPCIFGGLTLIHSMHPMQVIQLPLPELYCVLVHPHLQVPTKLARSILQPEVLLKDHVRQSGNLAALIACLYQQDISLLHKIMNDILIEPQRAQFVPGFYEVKQAAIDQGALAVSFSGSGPALFAWASSEQQADDIASVMQQHLSHHHIASDCWVSRMNSQAAHVKQIIRGGYAVC